MKGGLLYLKNIKQLEAFDIDPNHIINTKFVFNNSQEIDYDWIEKQMKYIDNLEERQKKYNTSIIRMCEFDVKYEGNDNEVL